MNTWIISGIILAIGFLICLFLILRNKWKVRKAHIKDYEAGRNKLTPEIKKSQEKKEEIESSGSGFDLAEFMIGIVILGIVVTMGSTILSEISTTLDSTSIESNAAAESLVAIEPLMNIIPIFITFGFVMLVISLLMRSFGSFRDVGLA